jgi:hypothetical protein
VSITKLADPRDKPTSEAARLCLVFPLPRATYWDELDNAGKNEVLQSIVSPLQSLADERFGRGHTKIVPTYLKKGSIEAEVTILVICGMTYAFFKDYEDLRSGVQLFVRDIQSICKYLRDRIKRTYSREIRRSRKSRPPKNVAKR